MIATKLRFGSFRNCIKNSTRLICRQMSNMFYKEEKVNVNGVLINTVQAGEGEKSVLLMPGALGSSWTDFAPQIEHLPKLLPGHTIIAWDPPGYGKSVPPKRQFGLDFFQNDAKSAMDLMRTLEREQFSMLGWSDGGITAMAIAGKYPQHIENLVIWGASAYINAEEVEALQGMRDVNSWSPRMREPMEKVYGKERFAELWSEWVDAAIDIFENRQGDFCCAEIKSIQAPTLILHGKKDAMIATEHVPYLRERLPHCKYYEFPEGKHNIHLRYAEDFNKLVADFLLNN